MADSYNKKERDKKKRKRKQDKAEKKRQNKIDGNKTPEFMYMDEDGNLSPTPPDPTKKKKIKLEDISISVPKKTDIDQPIHIRNGIVKFYNTEKYFGFIKDEETHEDYFVHADNLLDPIKENDKVTFEIGNGPKGPMAIEVKLTSNKPAPKEEETPSEEEGE